ncbi:MAG TPA: Spy/CpxP family protein refolding chaperone [Candidatus Acidoferrum sp.]|nr:Spy/CpxP family protein refolding chaperone [Candidatus Acidoferrum sp.]
MLMNVRAPDRRAPIRWERVSMECSGKGSLKMKTKLLFLLLLFAAVASRAMAASDDGEINCRIEINSHTGRRPSLVTPVEEPAITTVPTGPSAAADDPKQVLQDYDSLMIALTQKFSATLATIADAVKRGEVSSEQAREMSAEQYQVTHMQFELLSLWRGIEEQDSARIPDVEAKPDSTQESEVVMVALPFSSLQLNPSLVSYLSLTSSQVEAIQQVMMREQHSLEPLMTALRTAREKLLAIGSEHANEKQVKALADTEASLLARLIVANARMQSKIYKILSPDQRQKLSDLERTQGAVTSDSR